MGFDFTLIVPLLPSHCGFSSVLGRWVSSLVKSSVFLSMIVQQPVVILVLSQEGVRARPSTPPSWLILPSFLVVSFSCFGIRVILVFIFLDLCNGLGSPVLCCIGVVRVDIFALLLLGESIYFFCCQM